MRFSAITTLCAAPLALAGTLEAGLAGRGLMAKREAPNVQVLQGQAGVAAAAAQGVSIGQGGAISVNAAAGVTTTEIIIVWVNNGGGAPTQTVNSAAAAAANPSSATHTVCLSKSRQDRNTDQRIGCRWWLPRTCLQPRASCRCHWRYGYLRVPVDQPHSNPIGVCQTLRGFGWRYGYRICPKHQQLYYSPSTNGHDGFRHHSSL